MILRTSGIGVSIAFLREAQWGSNQDYTVEDRCIESQSCPADFSLPLHGAISYYPL